MGLHPETNAIDPNRLQVVPEHSADGTEITATIERVRGLLNASLRSSDLSEPQIRLETKPAPRELLIPELLYTQEDAQLMAASTGTSIVPLESTGCWPARSQPLHHRALAPRAAARGPASEAYGERGPHRLETEAAA